MKEMFPRMLEIAEVAHAGQKRSKNNEDYIEHVKRVANNFKDDLHKTLAIGHDIIEDHPEFSKIIKKEFPKLIDRLLVLTKKEGETYFHYIMRIRDSQDIDLIAIKLGDLFDNMSDLKESSMKDKYRFAFYILSNIL